MRFVIFTTQRSGSHMVSSALNSHPDIHCVGETENIAPLSQVYGEIKHYNQNPDLSRYDKIIHLLRNPEDVAKSRQSQRIKHDPHNFGEQEHEIHKLDKEQVKVESRRIAELQRVARKQAKNALEVTYEEIVAEGYDKILDFLGVSRQTLQSGYKKLNRIYK